MRETVDEATLAELLPGDWYVAASNFPMWLNGERTRPRFSYGLVSRDPLVLSDEVTYVDAEGEPQSIIGTDSWQHDEFVWRGKRLLKLVASRWSVDGMSDDASVLTIRFAKSLVSPSGIDIVVRDGVHHPELRAMIARATEQFGLTPEDFGSLSWLAPQA